MLWGRLGKLWERFGRPWGRLGSPSRESLGKTEEKPPGETSKNPRAPRERLGQLSFRYGGAKRPPATTA